MKIWKHIHTGEWSLCLLEGEKLSDCKRELTGEKAIVLDPLYSKPHSFMVYRVWAGGKEYRIAAGEFSMCCWGFYLEVDAESESNS